MTNQHIIRAWKDASFRNQLSAEQRAALPENPAVVVDEQELRQVDGGWVALVAAGAFAAAYAYGVYDTFN